MTEISAVANVDEASFVTVESVIQQTMTVLRKSAEACAPKRRHKKNTVSLKGWNHDTLASLKRRKKVCTKLGRQQISRESYMILY